MQTTNSWSLAMNSYPVTPNSDPMGPNLGSLEFWSIIFFNFLNVENSTLNNRWRIWKIYAEKMFLCWVMDDCRNSITDWPLIHTQWPLIRTHWVWISSQWVWIRTQCVYCLWGLTLHSQEKEYNMKKYAKKSLYTWK